MHAGMSIQRESRAFKSGTDVRAVSPRWFAVTRANLEQCRSAWPNWLRDALDCKRIFEFPSPAGGNGKNARALCSAFTAALRERTIRSLVRAKKRICSGGL